MRRCLAVLTMLVFAVSICGVAFAGNKNDLAYKNIDELDTASAVDLTDGVILTESDVPKQGTTVKSLLEVGVTREKVHNTTDMTSVLASETGKTFIAKQNTKFQLPAPADGLTYTFVAGAAVEIDIQANTTPTAIIFMIADGNSNTNIETAGTNTTGTSITLASDGTNWYVTHYSGTWETGGSWQPLDMGAQS